MPFRWTALCEDADPQSKRNAVGLPGTHGRGKVAMNCYRRLSADERVQITTLRY